MSTVKQYLNVLILLLLGSFVIFSIHGAFVGAERAKIFFNSTPMVVFWCMLLGLLIIGFAVYLSLRKRFGLLLVHAGCVLVLAGGMVGSEKGHALMKKQLFTRGSMTLHEGQISDTVILDTEKNPVQLPFNIRLKETTVEYYDEPKISFYLSETEAYSIPIQVGKIFELPNERGSILFNGAFENFKMVEKDGQMEPIDSPEPGYHPAYELIYMPKDQPIQPFFVFEQSGMYGMPGQTFKAEFVPAQMPKDYKSILQIIEKGKIIKEKTIEVNKPLYYGGYHFYQSRFGYDRTGAFSEVMVTSARGVWTVFVGYAVIFLGLILHFGPKLFGIKIVAVHKAATEGDANGN